MCCKFGSLTLLLSCLALLQKPPLTWSLDCEKIFTYYEEYGQNSFNVTCNGITKGYEHILENITINNEISLTVSNSVLDGISSNIFKNVRNIKILNLFNSTVVFDGKLAIFEKLEKLETLIIQDVPFQIGNNTLQGLDKLKRLELSNNGISAINQDGLKHLTNLERLSLTDNHVKTIADLQLCDLRKLKYLNLRRNLLKSLTTFYFFCSKHAKPLETNANSVNIQPNKPPLSYISIRSTSYDLVELDLSFNQIVDLANSLENLQKLRVLNVGFNNMVSVSSLSLKQLYMLQKLNFTHNQLRAFDAKTLSGQKQLSEVDLSHNNLEAFEISGLSQLQYLDLEHNKITAVSIGNLSGLTTLNLAGNQLETLTNESLHDVPKLAFLDLAGNHLNLRQNRAIFTNLSTLSYLYLNNNSITELSVATLQGLKRLRALDLSANRLSHLQLDTFADLVNLETLNLSKNSIESLLYPVMKPLENLRTLDVGSNKLLHIEYDVILSNLPRLSNINIKSNQLTCEDLGKIINFLKQKHIVYTSSEHLENLNQNVAGIPCKPEAKNLPIAAEAKPRGNSVLYSFGVFLVVSFSAVLTGIATYRFYIYLKRRRYRADEFELVLE
ncbi:hypothetical protein HUJ04_003406 [Dendroctonus ponderosae]|uniref:LRRCT domain-containing protein n=1 Tax=Dendroctonus ponderosae TaxID=77166 RepID=A0AAR5QCA7_DENPD|nr:hypothetical protein HUJ04_003406 [Dendroctonus ponderosae]KAH1003487.1 hypothetical protein HUJ04_003406 [Dendroctonus ponderosae]